MCTKEEGCCYQITKCKDKSLVVSFFSHIQHNLKVMGNSLSGNCKKLCRKNFLPATDVNEVLVACNYHNSYYTLKNGKRLKFLSIVLMAVT